MKKAHKGKIFAKLCIAGLLVLTFCQSPTDTHCEPVVESYIAADVWSVEEPLILSALHCTYPDESFQRISGQSLAKHVKIEAEYDARYWAVIYDIDFKAIFVNCGNNDNDSIDIYDWQAYKKEDLIASSLDKQCVSIWLVSPTGDYDLVWHDADFDPEILREKGGFAIHLNPRS